MPDAMEIENAHRLKVEATRRQRERAVSLARSIESHAKRIAVDCSAVGPGRRLEDNLTAAKALIGNINAAIAELDALLPEIATTWESN